MYRTKHGKKTRSYHDYSYRFKNFNVTGYREIFYVKLTNCLTNSYQLYQYYVLVSEY